jgi:hypothetical protein
LTCYNVAIVSSDPLGVAPPETKVTDSLAAKFCKDFVVVCLFAEMGHHMGSAQFPETLQH